MGDVALAYKCQGRYKEAELFYVKVLEINKQVRGSEDPDTMFSRRDLEYTHEKLGRWKEAEELFEQVFEA
jgi:tetratricopeptide (TPR) repeat protein